MNNRFLLTLGVCLASALTFSALPVAAQMSDLIRVKLPFAVSAGNVTLPAGDCSISELQDDGSSTILLVRSSTGKSFELMATKVALPHGSEKAETTVSFRNNDNQHQLESVRLAGREYGYDFPSLSHSAR
jgi:hypothetical protein